MGVERRVGLLILLLVWPTLPAGAQPQGGSGSVAASRAHLAERVVELPTTAFSAEIVRRGGAVERIDTTTAARVALNPGELLMNKSAAAAVPRPANEAERAGAARWLVPYEFRFLNAEGALRTARLVAEVAGGGLRMAPAGQGFTGDLFVALEDVDDRSRTYELPTPAQVLVTAPVDAVRPPSFAIDGTNRWVPVVLSAQDPPDEFKAKIRASTDRDGLEIDLKVVRPLLTVAVTPERIQGLGLELATISVMAQGLPSPEGRVVTITAASGSVTPTRVELDPQGLGQAQIRSISVGTTTVEAMSPPLAKGTSGEIVFVWPWVFLLAAIGGGGVGAFIRSRQARGRSAGEAFGVW